MRFKIDENLPVEVADLMRSAGHDAETVVEEGLRGGTDPIVIEVCREEKRILVTLDLDFADARTYPPRSFAGIIVLRLQRQDKRHVVAAIPRVLSLLEHEPIVRLLWIVEEHRVRVRGE